MAKEKKTICSFTPNLTGACNLAAYIYRFQFSTAETYSYILAYFRVTEVPAFVDKRNGSNSINWEGRVGVRERYHEWR